MAKKENIRVYQEDEEEQPEQQTAEIRQTINTKEATTLAKDVYDIRNFIFFVYNNRAVIARRLNIFSLVCGIIFTILYAAYNAWNIVKGAVTTGQQIAVYVLLGLYAALIIAFIVVAVCSNKANSKTVKKYNTALKIARMCIRLTSIAMAIAALVISPQNGTAAALRVVMVVFSIILIVIQAIPLLCGGVAKLARWAMSPAKGKTRFSKVILEWYDLVCTGSSISSAKKVSKKYIDDIGTCIDDYIIPATGKCYINKITATDIMALADGYTGDRSLIEGILKNVFKYALDCGYVYDNPTRGLDLEGSIEDKEANPVKKVKKGISRWAGKKLRNVVDGFLSGDDE